MKFNYGYERKRMELEFVKIAEQCKAAGASEEEIEDIHRFMLDELNSDRRFYRHTQSLDGFAFSDGDVADESRSPLFEIYIEQLSVCQGEISEWGRLDWIEDIDDLQLLKWFRTLSQKDIEFLTLIFVDGLQQKQAAKLYGCSEAAVSKRKARLLKNAKKFLSEG